MVVMRTNQIIKVNIARKILEQLLVNQITIEWFRFHYFVENLGDDMY